jgi:hypothetical protein
MSRAVRSRRRSRPQASARAKCADAGFSPNADRGHAFRRNGIARRSLGPMALDPYRRITSRKYRPNKNNRAPIPHAPWVVGAIGLVAMLAIAYQLSVTGFSGKTMRLADWVAQTPP